jgi:hypothetical protein
VCAETRAALSALALLALQLLLQLLKAHSLLQHLGVYRCAGMCWRWRRGCRCGRCDLLLPRLRLTQRENRPSRLHNDVNDVSTTMGRRSQSGRCVGLDVQHDSIDVINDIGHVSAVALRPMMTHSL